MCLTGIELRNAFGLYDLGDAVSSIQIGLGAQLGSPKLTMVHASRLHRGLLSKKRKANKNGEIGKVSMS